MPNAQKKGVHHDPLFLMVIAGKSFISGLSCNFNPLHIPESHGLPRRRQSYNSASFYQFCDFGIFVWWIVQIFVTLGPNIQLNFKKHAY